MRILGARIFLSFLAGKIKKIPKGAYIQSKHTRMFLKKQLAYAYFKRPYFSKSFGGKIKPV